ncbi:cysteine desulfurase CsdA [Parasalinivibrio latis]|uniref:cysteine desulfurase CsdA n=1 Tax=Parasalinivibrio latis TaxID=2952610 RepID=UPI0030E1C879
MCNSFSFPDTRKQFPALCQSGNSGLVYLDSAATAQKPSVVLDAIQGYYRGGSANVHRGSHQLTATVTSGFESARKTVADFIGASASEVVWTRGATESLNLIAQSYARTVLKPGDEIIVSELEHHANIVPWQLVAAQTGAKVIKWPADPQTCTLDLDTLRSLITSNTRLLAIAHITNVTGTRNPIEDAISLAHDAGAVVVIDGAQGIVHERVDMKALDADFYVFSGHKLFGPTGIGILYGKKALLDEMPPWHGGGKMVERVSFEGTTFTRSPGKFEAGTPNIGGAMGLAAAVTWFSQLDLAGIENHIHALHQRLVKGINNIEGVRIIGLQPGASIVSLVVEGVHHQDLAMLLDQQQIAVRSGNHCAHPLMDALGITGTLRVSFAMYNSPEDIDHFVEALNKACSML